MSAIPFTIVGVVSIHFLVVSAGDVVSVGNSGMSAIGGIIIAGFP